jgi:hypothetical protein
MSGLTPEGVIEAARRQTGLDAFDNDSFREGLDILAYDLARSTVVTELGLQRLGGLYAANLANRLRVSDYLSRHPEVLKAPVEKPVFILGMPRTGTTMTSYLFDQDPARRSLLKWEIADSAPPAARGEARTDPRCLAQIEAEAAWVAADPAAAARHYEAADGPSECTFLQAQDFKSLMLESLSPVPTYGDWILTCDMTSAYAYQRKVMQLLQSTNPGFWTLKMPSHALFIRTLFKVFPDARVIWTHRDPYAATASVLSLIGHAQPTMNTGADAAYMARHYPLQMAAHLSRTLEFSRERPEAVYNVYYDEMMRDPLGEMEQIYAWLGEALSPAARAGMQAWLEANPQGRFGRHDYSLDQWGLTRQGLAPYFADYLKAHPIAA